MSNFDDLPGEEQMRQFDVVARWITKTTEPYEDWEFDGDGLRVFVEGEDDEWYPYEEMSEFIDDLAYCHFTPKASDKT